MAQDRPVTDDDIEALRRDIAEQREDIREYLANEGVDVDSWDRSTARADGGDSDERSQDA